MNKKIALVGGLGLGAALMYLFDPDRGGKRRALIREKAEGAANKAGEYAEKVSSDLRNRAQEVITETKSIFGHEEVTDDVLMDRVHAKLGDSGHIGTIDVTAQAGTVILSGRALAKEVPDVLRAVRSVRGVQRVENQLVMHPEPGSAPAQQDESAPFGSQPEAAAAHGI